MATAHTLYGSTPDGSQGNPRDGWLRLSGTEDAVAARADEARGYEECDGEEEVACKQLNDANDGENDCEEPQQHARPFRVSAVNLL